MIERYWVDKEFLDKDIPTCFVCNKEFSIGQVAILWFAPFQEYSNHLFHDVCFEKYRKEWRKDAKKQIKRMIELNFKMILDSLYDEIKDVNVPRFEDA